ncbi:MAG: AIPR family protein [Candidatus Binatia bacterium]
MARKTDITTLAKEVRAVHEQNPAWTLDNAFIHWFLQAFLVPDSESAAKAVTGVSHDKGVDAVFVDDDVEKVFILQGKFHQSPTAPTEPRSDILAFTQLASRIVGTQADFSSLLERIDAKVGERLTVARNRIKSRKYGLHLYYVTTGKCSSPLKSEAESHVAQVTAQAEISILDRADILSLLTDYLQGAAPPIPFLDLRADPTGIAGSDGVSQRFDPLSRVESWLLTMRGRDVADLYKKAQDRLFARNIRGFLGETAINDGMKKTLDREPQHFWYFNNGITIVCDSARKSSERGETILRVTNPQVINGQQTTRVLHQAATTRSSVLVKVISIPRDGKDGYDRFEKLVSSIVAATNWQNHIFPSDLRSNDTRQIVLERDLAKLRYHYLRKRQTKREARRLLGNQFWFRIKKDELAQIIGACELDPYEVRSGKEGLFDRPHYDTIFDGRPVRDYLTAYWLGRLVRYRASGYPDRAYAKWHAMHFLWRRLAPLLRKRSTAEAFRVTCERDNWNENVYWAIDQVYLALLDFYRARRGKGAKATDVSTFFYRTHQHSRFEFYWRSANNRRRRRFTKALKQFKKELLEIAEE